MTMRSALPLVLSVVPPFVVLPCASVAAAEAEAEEDGAPAPLPFDERGVHLALGSGWGVPLGRAESGVPLGDVVNGQAPLAIDASFRALPHVFVGAYVAWGFGALDDCPPQRSCRAKDVRFGFNGRYTFDTPPGAVPWIGLGAGFEVLKSNVAQGSTLYQGVTFVDLGLGFDVPLSPAFAVGPTITLSAGEYTRTKVEGAGSEDVEGEIENPRVHGWALFGARFVFAP